MSEIQGRKIYDPAGIVVEWWWFTFQVGAIRLRKRNTSQVISFILVIPQDILSCLNEDMKWLIYGCYASIFFCLVFPDLFIADFFSECNGWQWVSRVTATDKRDEAIAHF